jgi:hypothetical protein
MPWAYQCLAQDLFTYRPYVQPTTLWTTWRQVECAAYLKSPGEPRGGRNVAQLKAVIEEWMTRPTGPPPVVVPPACRVDGSVMLQMIWHCHRMFKALFADPGCPFRWSSSTMEERRLVVLSNAASSGRYFYSKDSTTTTTHTNYRNSRWHSGQFRSLQSWQ